MPRTVRRAGGRSHQTRQLGPTKDTGKVHEVQVIIGPHPTKHVHKGNAVDEVALGDLPRFLGRDEVDRQMIDALYLMSLGHAHIVTAPSARRDRSRRRRQLVLFCRDPGGRRRRDQAAERRTDVRLSAWLEA